MAALHGVAQEPGVTTDSGGLSVDGVDAQHPRLRTEGDVLSIEHC
jgi:hypothetical protein